MYSSPVTLIDSGIPSLAPQQHRSDGPHVSEIINYLCLKYGYYDAADDVDIAGTTNKMMLGCAFEEVLSRGYEISRPGDYFAPGEQCLDGIYGTPDLVYCGGSELVLCEIKLTWMSSDREPTSTKLLRYWMQAAAYCRMLNIEIARVQVCHVNGNYKDCRDPVYNAWQRRFTLGETLATWSLLTRTLQEMRAAAKH